MDDEKQKGPDARAKLAAIRAEARGAFFERDAEVDGLLTALLAREHTLLLGPAGTGKSALARALCDALDGAEFFSWLLTKFSTPEEIFGPLSLAALERDELRRVTKRKLPEAHVAFLDEIFKANSAILNALLTALNERTFDNGNGGPTRLPLLTTIGASNELPESEGLDALYDRFMVRFWVAPISDRENLRALLTGTREPSIATRLTLDELEELQRLVDDVVIAPDQVDAMLHVKAELEACSIVASDRRWKKAIRCVKAHAVVDGRDVVDEDDLLALTDIMWKKPDQRTMVRDKVGSVVSPLTSEALETLDCARESYATALRTESASNGDVDVVGASFWQARGEMRKQYDKLARSIKAAGGHHTRAERVLAEIESLREDLAARVARYY